MKRIVLLAIIVLVACAPSSEPSPTWTPEGPKQIDITIELPTVTSTSVPTFTPIPPTFTLTATETFTPTATNTKIATATKTRAPARTAGPTRTPQPASIPTIFLPPTNTPEVVIVPPTNTPEVVVVPPTNPPVQACCKVCRAGKACGDSCISKDKTCHKPPGCACNG